MAQMREIVYEWTADLLYPSHLQTPHLVGARSGDMFGCFWSPKRDFSAPIFVYQRFRNLQCLGCFAISRYDTPYNSHFA